jgi:magnesium-protoporphyrin O-methyltransferase
MTTATYLARRDAIETYFDRTAADTWSRLTSDAPVSGIRATVRAGREQMRETLLSWLPRDLRGRRVLDAGCGTGAMAVELARRGAHVVAVDLSPTLVQVARERWPSEALAGSAEFRAGDMLDAALGRFDHVVAMDSLIHYRAADIARALAGLAARTDDSMVFTFAPRTPLLALMHAAGRLFPRADRAPAIEPVGATAIARRLRAEAALSAWRPTRTQRISSGFYMSQAMELVRQ